MFHLVLICAILSHQIQGQQAESIHQQQDIEHVGLKEDHVVGGSNVHDPNVVTPGTTGTHQTATPIEVVADKVEEVIEQNHHDNVAQNQHDDDKLKEQQAQQEQQELERQKREEQQQKETLRQKQEQEQKLKQEQEQQAKKEAEQKAKVEAEQKAKVEAEQKAKAETEQKAKAEAEQKAKVEQQQKLKKEQEQKAKQEQEKKKQEQDAQKLKQEEDIKRKHAEKLQKQQEEERQHAHHHDHDHHDHYHGNTVLSEQYGVQMNMIPDCAKLFNTNLWSQQLKDYLPKTPMEQLIASVVLTQLPSFPIFLILLLTLKSKGKDISQKSVISNMISFSFGTMLGDVFFHMLPEIMGQHSHDDHDHHHEHGINTNYIYIIGGILIFVLIDLLTIKFSGSKVEEHTHVEQSSVIVFLFSDFLHNITDGIAIGASYSLGIKQGITTTLAIFFHEIPHEIGDFAYLIKRKQGVFKVFLTQVVTSIGCFLGAYFSLSYKSCQVQMLCLTCGSFLYVSMSGIFPEIRHAYQNKPTFKRLLQAQLSIVFGLYLMHLVGQFE